MFCHPAWICVELVKLSRFGVMVAGFGVILRMDRLPGTSHGCEVHSRSERSEYPCGLARS